MALTRYENMVVREIAIEICAGKQPRRVYGPNRHRLALQAARLVCRWEREGVAQLMGSV